MHPGPGWIHRDELIKSIGQIEVAGRRLSVSNHQLLRWRDCRLLPPPKRVGRGRGRPGGSDSYYPWWALHQAAELAARLQRKRDLPMAGWAIWVLGFPVSDFARTFLVESLEDLQANAKYVIEEAGKDQSPLLDALARSRTPGFAGGLGATLQATVVPTVTQMFMKMQLGRLESGEFSEDDWERFQDAAFASAPHLADVLPEGADLELPPSEVEAAIVEHARRRDIPKTIRALKATTDGRLRMVRDEVQALVAPTVQGLLGESVLIPPDVFLDYFERRVVDPVSSKAIVKELKALGWKRPPPSPFEQLLRRVYPHRFGAKR